MFKIGKYRHKEKGFEIVVTNTGIYILPNAPMSMRINEIFDEEKWERITGKEK